ncbi:MAG: adenosylhomocysteinase [Candidatus Hadarchaeales archaeon]
MSRVRSEALAQEGRAQIEWASLHMPVMAQIRKEFEKERPLEGLRIGMALHVEAKTAVLVRTLAAGGARVAIAGCNPLSTKDECAAALAQEGFQVFAWKGETNAEYFENLRSVLETKPDILIDDGGDLISLAHQLNVTNILGACEETTTGVNRVRRMEEEGVLRFPVIAVNDSPSKRLFDNRFGTAESTLQALMATTNLQLAGKRVVVIGYGHVGRGIASRARGMGSIVYVVETDPTRALEAQMDGFQAVDMNSAAEIGDIFITCTGNFRVIRREHFERMKDGAILANAGHFDVEIDLPSLREMSTQKQILPDVEEYTLKDGRRLFLLCQGRLVNLAGQRSLGHPVEIMDMSFSLQALSAKYLAQHARELQPRVYQVPAELDKRVAELKLLSLGGKIERETEEQARYRSSWRLGT